MKRRPETVAADGRPVKRRLFLQPPPTPQQQVAREVNRQLARKADYKQTLNTRSTSATIDYSGTTYSLLENLTRGDNPVNNFEGSQIRIKSIRVRGTCYYADATNVMRIMVLQWRDSGSPVPSGIINNTGTIAAPYGSRYWTNKKNIKVLSDQLITMDGVNQALGKVDIYIPGFKCRPVWFATATDTVQSNGIFMLAISDSSTTTHPYFTWVSEIVFTD